MMHQPTKAATILAAVTCLVAIAALALQLYLLIDGSPENGLTVAQAIGRFLIFFTVLSNILVAASLGFVLLLPRSAAGVFFAKPSVLSAIAVYIAVVGLVYNIVLRPLWQPIGLHRLADELLHVVVPVLFVLYWLLFVPRGTLKLSRSYPWLLFPALYLVYALWRGNAEGFYAYPFLNVTQLGYERVLTNAAGVMLLFILVILAVIGIDKSLARRRKQ